MKSEDPTEILGEMFAKACRNGVCPVLDRSECPFDGNSEQCKTITANDWKMEADFQSRINCSLNVT